jgi:hypothetical protein
MSNRTQLKARLKQELGDTGTQKVWSDTLLDDLLVESVGWYSRLWPLQATAYRDVVAGQRTFEVPPGALGGNAGRVPTRQGADTGGGEGVRADRALVALARVGASGET